MITRFAVVLLFCVFSAALLSIGAGEGRADNLRFQLEYDYSQNDSETSTAAGAKTETESNTFLQRYRLDFDRQLYPALSVKGGGLFERSDNEVESAGETTESRLVRTSPYLDLLLSNRLYSAGLGFRRIEDSQSSSGSAETTLIQEQYRGSFNWRPEDLPSLGMQYTLTENFDRDRVIQDNSRKQLQLNSRYQPIEPLLLSYQANFNTSENRLDRVETEEFAHSGRIDYARRFWQGRSAFNGSYTLGQRRTEVVASGGEVPTLLPLPETSLPFIGLFALDDAPGEGELVENPALVDGNLTTSAGIDIGRASGDPTLRNLGLDMHDPDTRVNALRIWTTATGLGGSSLRNHPQVTNFFSWQVFTSNNGLDWTLWATVDDAPFDPFQDRFEVRFPTVQARFIKVTVSPLSLGVPGAENFPNIFVTELQAVLFRQAADSEGKATITSHSLSLNVRTRLLDLPSLYHTFSLFYTASEPSGVYRILISNGLSAQHRFTPTLTGSAQLIREDSAEPRGSRVGHRWGFTLLSTPVPALSHTLSYSGRLDNSPDGTSIRNSLFLNNRAALYRGVDVLLNGGASVGENESGEEIKSYQGSFGAIVTPHRSMTWDFSLSADRSERSGGVRPATSSTNRRGRVSLSLSPTEALNLFAALESVEQEEGRRTLRNYSVNWSPFRGGALQFAVGYSETLRPEDDSLERAISPVVFWSIRPGTVLTLSYSLLESESPVQDTTSQLFSTNLRATF